MPKDGQSDLPERVVTANMLVAYNLTFFRKAAGMTQEEFGERMGGWTKVAVSAAERSWDGKRVRQFDAGLIADIAAVLDIPLPALFLPPADDGESYRYTLCSEHDPDTRMTMADFFPYVLSEPPHPETPALQAYQDRLVRATNAYLESEAAEELAERAKGLATAEQIALALSDARTNRRRLRKIGNDLMQVIVDAATDNDLLQTILAKALEDRGIATDDDAAESEQQP